eukprot:c10237_g1_i1.p1 GENE.c10237_g1_i1~~c10237_g1_i1.p1  ORF type:complete len:382 (+),score=158.38 c10237_g1_i1:42-1148(+)
MNTKKVPVTIITGALGSGKTTLLKHILKNQPKGKKVCVIQNEVSEFVIEDALYVGTAENGFEKYLELPNGCVCCSVRTDFVQALETLSQKNSTFDYIIVETSGLADPGAVVSMFWVDDALEGNLFLDSVIAVVDGLFLKKNFEVFNKEESLISIRQIGYADLVFINKIDLLTTKNETEDEGQTNTKRQVTSEWSFEDLLREVKAINPLADVISTVRCDTSIETILDRRSFDLTKNPENAIGSAILKNSDIKTLNEHKHDASIEAVGFQLFIKDVGCVDIRKFSLFLDSLLFEKQVPGGGEIFRMKAIVCEKDSDCRTVIQGVHSIFDYEEGAKWEEELPSHKLVFIGRDLNCELLKQSFLDRAIASEK